MLLTHLSLTNFRNYQRLETDLEDGLTILVGANAQGKTSLLESIYYLTAGASPHTASDRQLINFLGLQDDSPFSRIVGEVRRGNRIHRIEIRLILEPVQPTRELRLRKEILINGIKRRVRDLAGGFNAVMFLPQDLRVIEGPPGERRRFLNSTLTQADPRYAASLSEYGKVLSQRNALLKKLQDNKVSEEQLTFWDEQLTEHGAQIIRARSLALHELETLAGPIHDALTRGAEALRLAYKPSFDPLPQPEGQMGLPVDMPVDRSAVSPEEIRRGMLRALQNSQAEEIAAGITLIGPQRDEIRFLANGIDLHHYGSRGQNRTAMLSVKLAELAWLEAQTGETPVLLLDEMLAELDVDRRAELLSRVVGTQQAIVSTTDLDMFEAGFLDEARVWHIDAGSLTPD